MSRACSGIRRAVVVVMLLGGATAAAQEDAAGPDLDTALKRLYQASIDERQCLLNEFAIPADATRQARYEDVVEVGTPISLRNGITTVELAEAAIQTSIDGTVAGVSVAPLALAGVDTGPSDVTVTLAALEEGRTRLGLAWAIQSGLGLSPGALGLEKCKLEGDALKDYRRKLDQVRLAHEDVCQRFFSGLIPQPPEPTSGDSDSKRLARMRKMWEEVRYSCGFGTTPAPQEAQTRCKKEFTFKDALLRAWALLEFRRERLEQMRDEGVPGAEESLRELTEQMEAAENSLRFYDPGSDRYFEEPGVTSCHSDEDISRAYTRTVWSQTRYTGGAAALVEAFPQRFGFNPEPDTALPSGEVAKWEARVEGALQSGRLQLVAGAGVGVEREKFTDDFVTVVSPSLAIAYVLGSLSSEPLFKNGQLHVLKEGKLPPRLSIGLDASTQLSIDRPETQRKLVREFRAALFFDFIFTDKLSFRLGIPVEAETVTRESDDVSDLQWSIPVFVQTALEL